MSREMLPHEESIAMRAIGIVRRRLAVAAVAFAAVIAAAVAFALYLPDLYRASAIVLVERPLGDTVLRSTTSNDLESRLYTIQQTVLSRDRLIALVDQFNLYPELRARGSWEEVLTQARQDIQWKPNGPEQVSGRAKTVTFTLTYTGDDRKTVADVTNAIAGLYVDYNEQMRSSEAHSATQYYKAQLDSALADVNQKEARLRSFVAANERLLPQAASLNLAAVTRLNDDLRQNREQQRRTMDARDRLIDSLAEAARSAAAAPAPAALNQLGLQPSREFNEIRQRLEKAREELLALEAKGLLPSFPDVAATRERIAALEAELEDQQQKDLAAFKALQAEEQKKLAASAARTPVRSRSVESYDQDLARLAREEQQLQAQIEGLMHRFDSAPGVQQEYLLIQRDYQAAKDNYDVVLRRYEEAKLTEGVETSGQAERFRILEAALPPEGPAAPNRPRLLIMGFLLAFAAAAAAVIAREQFDTSFHSVDDVREFTSIPVLATIPQIGAAPRRGYVQVALGAVSAVAAIILVGTLSAYIANGNETIVRMLQRAG